MKENDRNLGKLKCVGSLEPYMINSMPEKGGVLILSSYAKPHEYFTLVSPCTDSLYRFSFATKNK
jgi:hypothetical protein